FLFLAKEKRHLSQCRSETRTHTPSPPQTLSHTNSGVSRNPKRLAFQHHKTSNRFKLHSLSILPYCAMAERCSPQALPDPNLEPNDSDQKPHNANQTQRLTESPSAAMSQRGELRSSGERSTEFNLETLGGAATSSSSVQTLAVHHHRSDDLHGNSAASNSSGKAESKVLSVVLCDHFLVVVLVVRDLICSASVTRLKSFAQLQFLLVATYRLTGSLDIETDAPPEKEIIQGEAQPLPTQTNQLQLTVCSTPLSELPPTSVIQSSPSVSSPFVPKQKLSTPKVNNARLPEVDKKSSSGGKTLSAVSVARSSASDGYNWRKYGQKQVKSPTGSRSYYRCTHSDCCAKKIECCDHSGHVIEIVYKSEHSHDPPRKINSLRENKILSASEPIVEKSVPDQPVRLLKDPDPSISSKESLQEALCSTDKKRPNSSSISNGKVILKEEPVNEPEPKKRMKKGDLTDMDSPVKHGKKPKFVIHAAGDVGISGDGYRWRKYGQKMVKGNPHPRCMSKYCLLSVFFSF
ncbi:hypothetical protein V8G54_017764, partial [Vigna mungo]